MGNRNNASDGGNTARQGKPGREPNRKLNSVLFILGATVVNIVLMVGLVILFLLLYGQFLSPLFSETVSQIAIVLILFSAVALTYFLYHLFIKWLPAGSIWIGYFDPLFRIGRKK
jgi:cytochrome b subunit of formate dehydrogenase